VCGCYTTSAVGAAWAGGGASRSRGTVGSRSDATRAGSTCGWASRRSQRRGSRPRERAAPGFRGEVRIEDVYIKESGRGAQE